MRLIDADKLEQIIKENIKDYEETNDPIRCDANKIHLSTVRGMPTVDAEPVKHGVWETHDVVKTLASGKTLDGFCQCSECGDIFDYCFSNHKFCPNCGAKMDGGVKNDL